MFSTEAHPFSIDAVRRGGRFRAERGVEEAGRVRGSSSSNGEDGGGGNATLHSNNPPPFTHVDVTPAIRNPETHASHGDDDGEEGGDGSRGGYGEAVPLSAEAGEMGRRGSGAWAALRASGGEGYRLGPEGWRDTNILFWVQVGVYIYIYIYIYVHSMYVCLAVCLNVYVCSSLYLSKTKTWNLLMININMLRDDSIARLSFNQGQQHRYEVVVFNTSYN